MTRPPTLARQDPLLTVESEHGDPVFRVHWSEPVELSFTSRTEAEGFLAHLRASGRSVVLDDQGCAPCQAHHASRHGCPSCGADLGLRAAPEPGRSLARPEPLPVPYDPFLIPREQHRIREETAARSRSAHDQWRAALADADRLLDHGEARERAEARI